MNILSRNFRTNSGAVAFFTSIIVWGIGIGCFSASLNNYLVDIHSVDEFQRGWMEFFREMPGLLLVVFLAILHRVSDWRILRIGTFCSMIAVLGLLIPSNLYMVTFLITFWSLGDHLVMPIRSSIAVSIAKPEHEGVSLGFVTATMNAGTIVGSILVAIVFGIGLTVFHCENNEQLYNVVWILVFFLLLISIFTTFTKNAPNKSSNRPRLYVHRKFSRFYVLELFYGARKQIFLTFGPFVLIVIYGLSTMQIAVLLAIGAFLNMITSPIVGRLTDRLGYRTIMICDTLILFWVCLIYGYANRIFSMNVAIWVVCINFLLDHIISTAALASNLYAKDISSNGDEFTSTLTTGISVNHLISILSAPLGGWIWQTWGVGMLFTFAAIMALCNSLFAYFIPQKTDASRFFPKKNCEKS
ncbi:MAG: MFS transporter [Planctomycetia bacterium]|nr:MFS transporter [Planctomycetia bacterium]